VNRDEPASVSAPAERRPRDSTTAHKKRLANNVLRSRT